MILSYKLYINILLEPVKVDTKRTKTKNKTARKYSNDKIIVLYLKYRFFIIIYEIKSLGLVNLNIFLGSVG